MISSKNVNGLPDKDQLRKICKAISVLDAILSPEWEYRYYSYNSHWAEEEEVFEMRDGEGDNMLILFRKDGCVINGSCHEYETGNKEDLTHGLPLIYNEFIFGEPVKTYGTTFCIWTDESGKWKSNTQDKTEDGSEEKLGIFDGKASSYIDYAAEYYEADVSEAVIKKLYKGEPLTKDMVLEVDSEFEDWEQLQSDLEEIDYIFDHEE